MAFLPLLYSLVLDTAVSWMRMLIALAVSMVLGLFLGIWVGTSRRAEQLLIPVLDVLQTLPILAFFPFAVYIIVAQVPGAIGINIAVIVLIVTSMLWNIAFGAYEAIKSMPAEFFEMSRIFKMGRLATIRKVLVPGCMPKVVDQAMLSWAVGLFYLVTSEVFSTGSAQYAVRYGIGAALINLAFHGTAAEYVTGILVFIAFVVVTRLALFGLMEKLVRKGGMRKPRQEAQVRYFHFRETRQLMRLPKAMAKNVRHGIRRIERAMWPKSRYSTGAAVATGSGRQRKALAFAALAVAAVCVAALFIALPGLAHDEYMVAVALLFTLGRVWLAFAAVVLVSVPLGIYIVFFAKSIGRYTTGFQLLASIPATVLLPVLVLALKGSVYGGELVALLIFFLSGIWYMVFSIVSTRSSINPEVGEVRRVFHVNGRTAMAKIYLMAILPGAITGGITAIAAEWNASIVAERFTSSAVGSGTVLTTVGTGLGKFLDVALTNGQTWLMLLGLINLTVVIIIINRLVWRRLYNKVESVYR